MAKNVLLIEYEQRDRDRLRALLAPPEFALIETHDGEEGLAAFASSRFDLVLLCGKLPRLSSSDVIREIRNKGGVAAPPIILLSNDYSGSNSKADAQKVGAFEIVPKPFTDEALTGAVRSALDSTGQGAKAARLPAGAASRLTSTDIFSDLLDELGRDASGPSVKPPPARPAASAAAAAAAAPDGEVERRLRDTLSGVRPMGRAAAPPTPASAAASEPVTRPGASRASTAEDIDRMLSETLRIKIPRSKPTVPAAAPPAGTTPGSSRRPEPAEAVAGAGPDRFGQYELLERIASGGMAELFRARRTGVEGFQKIVAIKKILPHIANNDEFITMFADEAKLAAQLSHPNIVHIYDLGKIEAGGYFIAMEYVEGTDLRTILRSGRELRLPLPVPLAVYVACKVASALDYAHRRRGAGGEELRIVHRDVSPQNILISHEGEIKLCDFGIAKADTKASRTESGSLKGKLQYMSPEQAWGRAIDHRSDLFSLGTVLHEMLTGERLFRGESDMTVLEAVRKAEVTPPSRTNPEVPAVLDTIVLKALARDPNARFTTGSEMLRDLESVLYTYAPAPGSADLAIYLDRLREQQATAVSRTEAAAPVSPAAPRASPRAPVPIAAAKESTAEVLRPIAAAAPPAEESSPEAAAGAGVFGSFSPARLEAEKRKRAPIYVGIAAVVLIGGVLGVVLSRRKPEAAPGETPVPMPAATALPLVAEGAPAAAVVTPAGPAMDQRAIEQEIQKQLAARRLEMQKAAEGKPTVAQPARAIPTAAAVIAAPPTEAPVARLEPTAAPALPTPAPPEPTVVAAETVAAAPAEVPPAADREPEVSRGDLVGPGPGVVEPTLIAAPRIAYPPLARQQRLSGRVVVLVLVDEEGAVTDARIQKGLVGRTGINETVLEGVRSARFRAATKNGVPVKMWRTVVVEVKP